jgi:hypothetical protein
LVGRRPSIARTNRKTGIAAERSAMSLSMPQCWGAEGGEGRGNSNAEEAGSTQEFINGL